MQRSEKPRTPKSSTTTPRSEGAFEDDLPSIVRCDALIGIHPVEFGAIDTQSREVEEDLSVRQVRLGNLVSVESLGDLDGSLGKWDRSEARQPFPQELAAIKVSFSLAHLSVMLNLHQKP